MINLLKSKSKDFHSSSKMKNERFPKPNPKMRGQFVLVFVLLGVFGVFLIGGVWGYNGGFVMMAVPEIPYLDSDLGFGTTTSGPALGGGPVNPSLSQLPGDSYQSVNPQLIDPAYGVTNIGGGITSGYSGQAFGGNYGYGYGSYGSSGSYSGNYGASEYFQKSPGEYRETCEARKDFVIQIAPGGCTPSVVRSDLLAEQNVPVFCKLQAIQINPTIEPDRIRSITFNHVGAVPEGVAGSPGYYRPRVALSPRYGKQGFPSFNNVGFVVIKLKKQESERDMLDFVSGNLTARISYDIPDAFGMGLRQKVIPVLNDEQWSAEYREYGFLDGKGFLRLERLEGDHARVSVYSSPDYKIDSFDLSTGQTSAEKYLPGFYCNAAYTVSLLGGVKPQTKAVILLDSEKYDVYSKEKFADNLCQVDFIKSDGAGTGRVRGRCYGQVFDIELNAKSVLLDVNEVRGEYNMGDEVNGYNVGAIGRYKNTVGSSNDYFVVLVKKDGVELGGPSLQGALKSYVSMVSFGNAPASDKFVVLKQDEQAVDGVSFAGFGQDAAKYYGGDFERYFDEAIREYNEVEASYDGMDITFEGGEIKAGKEALENARDLADATQQIEERQKIEQLLKDTYGDSSYGTDYFSGIDVDGASNIINVGGEMHVITLQDIVEPNPADVSVELIIDRDSKKLNKDGEIVYLEDGTVIQLNSFDETYAKITGMCSQTYVTANPGISPRQTVDIRLGGNFPVCGKQIHVQNINLVKNAVVRIDPIERHVGSEINFSYAIGIEKRAIELSPEKTEARIEKLNENIEKWSGINEDLGKIVKSLKSACFITSAVLQVKNLFGGMGGTALAREQVMKGENGWNMLCKQVMNTEGRRPSSELVSDYGMKDVKYGSEDDCIQKNAATINQEVEFYKNMVSQQNDEIKRREDSVDGLVQKSGLWGQSVDSQRAFDEHLRAVQGEYSREGSLDIEGKESINIGETIGGLNNEVASISDLKKIELLMEARKSEDATVGMKKRVDAELYNELSRIKEISAIDQTSIAQQAQTAGVISGNIGVSVHERRGYSAEYYKGGKFSSDVGVDGLGGEPAHIIVYNSQEYYASLNEADSKFVTGRIFVMESDGGVGREITKTDAKDDEYTQIRNANPYVLNSDSGVYNNYYKNPKVRYYETGSYKGMPAVVPVDIQKGWYAGVRPTLPSFGNVDVSQESGRVSSFWLCNVGSNGLEEFSSFGKDTCQNFRTYTGQPFIIHGLSERESQQLVSRARTALDQAAEQHKKGVRNVDILGAKRQVDNPAISGTDIKCTDFMSPGDCKIMFNVCDPVICPASRCDLGGKFRVDDVVQSGIVGSLFLCLPNYKEGIYVPVCLSGVHAGIDTYVSILEASRDCLQENLDTGKYVGICDEITAVYKCEFFWRQLSPILNQILPRLLQGLTGGGGGLRGGGEYLFAQSAWDNTQASVDYFKDVYAVNALRAFRVRSTQEIGTEVCKSFVSLNYPNKFDILTDPDSPVQFSAWFDEIPMTDATVPAMSHYKVFYHIYAGNDIGVYYSVYLKDMVGSSYVQDVGFMNVKTGYINRGEYVSEADDFTAPAGFQQLCVRVNGQEECGFKQVSTSFALNYVRDKYMQDQITESDITSEKHCVSGTPNMFGMINPNLQAGVEESTMPQIYERGIIRICSSGNPGSVTGPDRWTDVGHCGNEKIRCWLDEYSIDRAITAGNYGVQKATRDELERIAEGLGGEVIKLTREQAGSLFSEIGVKIGELKNSVDNVNVGVDIKEIESQAQVILGELNGIGLRFNLIDEKDNAKIMLYRGWINGLVARAIFKVKKEEVDKLVEGKGVDCEGLDGIWYPSDGECFELGPNFVDKTEEASDEYYDELCCVWEEGEVKPVVNGNGNGVVAIPAWNVAFNFDEYQVPDVLLASGDNEKEYYPLVHQISESQNINFNLVRAIIDVESDWNPRAKSRAGAIGLMQIMGITFDDVKQRGDVCPSFEAIDQGDSISVLYSPEKNLNYGTCYLNILYNREGVKDMELLLAAYNWGIGNVRDNCGDTFDSCSNIPKETQDYIPKVKRAYDEYSDEAIEHSGIA